MAAFNQTGFAPYLVSIHGLYAVLFGIVNLQLSPTFTSERRLAWVASGSYSSFIPTIIYCHAAITTVIGLRRRWGELRVFYLGSIRQFPFCSHRMGNGPFLVGADTPTGSFETMLRRPLCSLAGRSFEWLLSLPIEELLLPPTK
jgi:hypothetical protein